VKYIGTPDSRLIRVQNNQLYVGVNSWSGRAWDDPNFPEGVYLRSRKSYNCGTVVIADFSHVPATACGSWPAFWLAGKNWPFDGEIDIMEAVNEMTHNQITIHTRPDFYPEVGPGGQTGQTVGLADCGAGVPAGAVGCGVINTKQDGWGSGFNAAGGGLYAMLWTADSIKIWSWSGAIAPPDTRTSAPDPSSWGTPVANWAPPSGQNFQSPNFVNMSIASRSINAVGITG
jgi:hypothetical protein